MGSVDDKLEAAGVLAILGVTVAIVTVRLTVKAFGACVARGRPEGACFGRGRNRPS